MIQAIDKALDFGNRHTKSTATKNTIMTPSEWAETYHSSYSNNSNSVKKLETSPCGKRPKSSHTLNGDRRMRQARHTQVVGYHQSNLAVWFQQY